ncbi:MAG: chemotaxis protein CheD [Bacillota bacterium]
MYTVQVKIADLAVLKEQGMLITYGLGSCVGIALYESTSKIAGLAHILLNDSTKFIKPGVNNYNPAKFADTAIPVLLHRMIELGAHKGEVIAKIVGGASLFNFQSASGGIGEKNVEAVRSKLAELNVPLHAAEVGGNYGRTMKLLAETGAVVITRAGKGAMTL